MQSRGGYLMRDKPSVDVKSKMKAAGTSRQIIPKSIRKGMNVDAVVYGNSKILKQMENDALYQLTNVACLPGIVAPVIAAPDIHWGYGLPMGAVGAFDDKDGVISCGCTGFDINCGIHMIRTNLTRKQVEPKIKQLIDTLFQNIPCGVGAKGKLRLTLDQLDDVLRTGANWAVENGYAVKADVEHMEEEGCMTGADPAKVSDMAKKRALPQLGTLGAGNHFLEVQSVDEIFDAKTAKAFGITKKDQVIIMLHCGSRGFGHQVASDYLRVHEKAAKKYGIELPDPQLVCAPVNSKEGQDYYKAMKCAVNYAFANRTIMTAWIRESFEQVFDKKWKSMEMDTIYDVCHNICKLEEHEVNGKKKKLYVHRKGATRALPAGHPLVPKSYRKVGQPVLIAGSMGTASYVLVGTEKGKESFFSTCHGAGRVMSRHKALKLFRGEQVKADLMKKQNIYVRATHGKVIAEEAPGVYKNVDEVIESVHSAGISKKVARLVPLGVAKG
jgi:tRNA-splicing ligase RtcB (3'-phosphate/5'-hydroxy nucleic acid ligase)